MSASLEKAISQLDSIIATVKNPPNKPAPTPKVKEGTVKKILKPNVESKPVQNPTIRSETSSKEKVSTSIAVESSVQPQPKPIITSKENGQVTAVKESSGKQSPSSKNNSSKNTPKKQDLEKKVDSKLSIEKTPSARPSAELYSAKPSAEKLTSKSWSPVEWSTKANLVVCKVLAADYLSNSEKLIRLKVQVGPDESDVKQILTGLRKFVKCEELHEKLVVAILNLRTVKMAGEPSQGMILSASYVDGESKEEYVRPIMVPDASMPGDRVYVEGAADVTNFNKEFRQWNSLIKNLTIQNSNVTYSGAPLLTKNGPVTVDSKFPDGSQVN